MPRVPPLSSPRQLLRPHCPRQPPPAPGAFRASSRLTPRPSPSVLQGMFLKRQMEVSTEFAECMTERLLTSESLWHNLLTGSKSEAFVRQAAAHRGEEKDGLQRRGVRGAAWCEGRYSPGVATCRVRRSC